MNKYLLLALDGFVVFTLIWLFNYFVFVKGKRKLKDDDMPFELVYLSSNYGVDPKKIDFKKFQMFYCFLNAFIITTTYLLANYLIKTTFYRIIVGIVVVVLLIIICYGLLARFYLRRQEKKSIIKENNKKKEVKNK